MLALCCLAKISCDSLDALSVSLCGPAMDVDENTIHDSLSGSMLGRVSQRSSQCSRMSRRASSASNSSSNINIDDLSLLSESFPARLWQRWTGLVGASRYVLLESHILILCVSLSHIISSSKFLSTSLKPSLLILIFFFFHFYLLLLHNSLPSFTFCGSTCAHPLNAIRKSNP